MLIKHISVPEPFFQLISILSTYLDLHRDLLSISLIIFIIAFPFGGTPPPARQFSASLPCIPSVGLLWSLHAFLEPPGALLAASWSLFGRSWGGPGVSWEPLGALLGGSWGLLAGSWALLGGSWTLLRRCITSCQNRTIS